MCTITEVNTLPPLVDVDEWYWVGALILRRRRGVLKGLIMEVTKLNGEDAGRRLFKVPGGMEEWRDSRNPFRTLERELEEEIGLTLRGGHRPDPTIIDTEKLDDGHVRYLYEIWRGDLHGIVRNEIKRDRNSILGVPMWKDFGFFDAFLCRSQRDEVLPVFQAHL